MLGDAAKAAQYTRSRAEVQRIMDAMDKPIVAAVNGIAMGGGLELAIRCHSIVATKNARFQFPEITLGISPGIGGAIVPYRQMAQGCKAFSRDDLPCKARQYERGRRCRDGQ